MITLVISVLLVTVSDVQRGNLLLMMITHEELHRWRSWVEATVVPMVLEVEGRSRSTSGETDSTFVWIVCFKMLKLHPGVVTRTLDTQRQSCQTLEAALSRCPASGEFLSLKWILSKLHENIIIQIFLQGPTIWQKEQKQRGCRQYRGGTGLLYHFCFRNAKVTQFSHTNFKRLQKAEEKLSSSSHQNNFPSTGRWAKDEPPKEPRSGCDREVELQEVADVHGEEQLRFGEPVLKTESQ